VEEKTSVLGGGRGGLWRRGLKSSLGGGVCDSGALRGGVDVVGRVLSDLQGDTLVLRSRMKNRKREKAAEKSHPRLIH